MAASFDNPFYYLENFQHVLDWVGSRYWDLLTSTEHQFLAEFSALPEASRALMVRMIMRKGNAFRASKLCYAEIGDIQNAMTPLVAHGWMDEAESIHLPVLFDHLTKAEILAIFRPHIRCSSAPKAQILDELLTRFPDPKLFSEWTAGDECLYTLQIRDVCDCIRLLYFGNLHQDWTEFVLAELGLFQYEVIELSPGSRAFRQRCDVDQYFRLHRCRERLDAAVKCIDSIIADINAIVSDNEWINARRAKLLFRIGQYCERSGDLTEAESVYRRCGYAGARARRIRVLERLQQSAAAFALAEEAITTPESASELQQVKRALPRLAKRVSDQKFPRATPPPFERIDLGLSANATTESVEYCVLQYFDTPDAPVYYVENTLINSLFGLLCWDIIFAPLPGAFFHPFHSGPADLLHPEFRHRRADLFAQRFAQLDSDDYRTTIEFFYTAKRGIQSPFVVWGALDDTLLQHALDCLPPAHLRHWFMRLLDDIRANRAGMPDLIQFWPAQKRYRMVEVKGPGDRLQDNQLRWIEFCAQHAMPVSVCFVQWQEAA